MIALSRTSKLQYASDFPEPVPAMTNVDLPSYMDLAVSTWKGRACFLKVWSKNVMISSLSIEQRRFRFCVCDRRLAFLTLMISSFRSASAFRGLLLPDVVCLSFNASRLLKALIAAPRRFEDSVGLCGSSQLLDSSPRGTLSDIMSADNPTIMKVKVHFRWHTRTSRQMQKLQIGRKSIEIGDVALLANFQTDRVITTCRTVLRTSHVFTNLAQFSHPSR